MLKRALVVASLSVAACSASPQPAVQHTCTTGASATAGGGGSSSSGSTSSGSSGTTGSASSSGGTGGSSGSSGTTGVPQLLFAFTGDTRPDSCDDLANYPAPVMDTIVASMKSHGVAFALDTGDHLKICGSDSKADAASSADQQLALYTQSACALGKPFYLTMGNHECRDHSALCTTSDAVLSVFMGYVASQITTTQPYYTFDVPTSHGPATFVFVADTAWDSAQATWLENALTHGDGSTYTIIAKHVPSSNTTDFATNADELAIIERHRFALLVDAHAHLYAHAGEGGREVTLGLGGAPLSNPGVDDFGYGLVAEQPDGTLQVSIITAATGTVRDSFALQPNR